MTANGLGGRPMWVEKSDSLSRNLGSLRRGVDTKGETWLLGWGLGTEEGRRGVVTTTCCGVSLGRCLS